MLEPIERADRLGELAPLDDVLARKSQRALHARILQHVEEPLAVQPPASELDQGEEPAKVIAVVAGGRVEKAVRDLATRIKDGLDHRTVRLHIRHDHGDVRERTVHPRAIPLHVHWACNASEYRIVHHLDLAAHAGRTDNLNRRILSALRDLARSAPDGFLHFPENRPRRRPFSVKRFPIESDSLGNTRRLLEIHEQTQRLPSRNAQRLEKLVLARFSIFFFWIIAALAPHAEQRLAFLVLRLDIAPELAAGIAVKHHDIVLLRQPNQNLRL